MSYKKHEDLYGQNNALSQKNYKGNVAHIAYRPNKANEKAGHEFNRK